MRAKSTSGFVYLWRDAKRQKFYLGSHWGAPSDRYICGSKRMLVAYLARPETFKRRIIAVVATTRADLHIEEQRWLNMIDDSELGNRYYNVKKFATGADPVAASAWMMGNKHGLGKPCPPERRGRIAFAQIDKIIPPDVCAKISAAKVGKPVFTPEKYRQLADSRRGIKRAPEIGRKISAAKTGVKRGPEVNAKAWETRRLKPKSPLRPLKPWQIAGVPQTTWRRWFTDKPERIISNYIPLGLPI
jgi:hypothetical protein